MAEEINTGGGTAISGDVGTGGGRFTGRDQLDNENKVNVYVQNPLSQLEERRSLSMSVEESLRIEIRELRAITGHLADQVGKLDKTIALSGAETESMKGSVKVMGAEIVAVQVRLNAMERLVTALDQRTPVFDSRMLRNIFYAMLGVVGLLVIIAYLLSSGGAPR